MATELMQFLPDNEQIIRRHRVNPASLHTAIRRKYIKVLQITNTGLRIPLSQPLIEIRIACGTEITALFEGAVTGKHAVALQACRDESKHFLDGREAHDVRGVARKNGIVGRI